jgi:PAS domain S-box-containing protein
VSASLDAATAPRASLLLVDDRPENLLALEAALEPIGHDLISVQSGEAALRELLHGDFACILLDVQMPDLDGFETAALIKQRARTSAIPIIFLTALSKEDQNVFRGYSAGAVDYIFKPFDPHLLRSKVAVFVELWQKNEQIKRQAALLHEQQLARVERANLARYRQLADAMPQIVWTADQAGRANYFNQRWFEYTGLTLDEAGPDAWLRVVHPDDLPESVAERERSLLTSETFEVEYRFRSADGGYRWHLGRAIPIRDVDGAVEFWIGTATDIHDRKRVEEQQRFLLEAGSLLAGSLDYRTTLASVAELAVPEIADWCAVDVVERDGSLQQLAIAHADRAKVTFARELQDRYPPDREAGGVGEVIRTGQAQLVSEIPPELVREAARDELHAELLEQLGLESWMCVPLRARDRVLGAISFVAAESGRRFGDGDLRLAEELARRASTAIENAELYREVEERAQAARVIAAIGDGVVMLDGHGIVRLWNPAAEAIVGIPAADVLGRPATEALPGFTENAPLVPVSAAPGRPAIAETVPIELEGREIWLSISGVGFEDGTVYAFRDLTQERALEEMRQDLVATVSHELRTPLAAIYGAALTLRRSDLELHEELRERLLEIVTEESERLSVIVNDLLLASQLDSGRLQVNIARVDARTVVQTVVEAARLHLPQNVSLEVSAAGKLPPVQADPEQLRQVLANLVDNAVKYSPDGGTVTVALEPREGCVRFAVQDSGLGIPAGEQRRIFEKFYRLDPQMTRGIGGTGLGLYICRELVRRVDGKIWVESSAGSGSTFFVEMPLARTTKPKEKAKTAQPAAA